GRQSGVRAVCDVNALVNDTLDLMHSSVERHGACLHVDMAEDLPAVMAEPVALQQLIASLLCGGMESMKNLDSSARLITVSTAKQDNQVSVSVADGRQGVSRAVCDDLFDPLTDRGGSSGGLNLALGRAMVESLGGRIWGTPNPDGGLKITFSLPVA